MKIESPARPAEIFLKVKIFINSLSCSNFKRLRGMQIDIGYANVKFDNSSTSGRSLVTVTGAAGKNINDEIKQNLMLIYNRIGVDFNLNDVLNMAISICDQLREGHNLAIQKDSRSRKRPGSNRAYVSAVCLYHSLKQLLFPGLWPRLIAFWMGLCPKNLTTLLQQYQLYTHQISMIYISNVQDVILFINKNLLKYDDENCQTLNYIIYNCTPSPSAGTLINELAFIGYYNAANMGYITLQLYSYFLYMTNNSHEQLQTIFNKFKRKENLKYNSSIKVKYEQNKNSSPGQYLTHPCGTNIWPVPHQSIASY